MLPLVISGTHFGRVWMVRILLLVFLAIIFLVSGKKGREGRTALFLMLIIVLLVSMTESAYGHPADKGDFSLREINDWFHLLGAEAWGGGLLALSILVLPRIIKPEDALKSDIRPPLIAGIARRFSVMAGWGVAVMAVTAAINYLTYIGGARALLGTPYGLTVAAKVILFLVLLPLAAFNRYVNVPALEQWAGFPAHKPGIAGRAARRLYLPFVQGRPGHQMAILFKRLVRAEMFLIMALLFCAAILSHEAPASHYMHMKQTGHDASRSLGAMPG
ncbi:MAG: CopD family protein [Nitrospiraceae bacterium]|nr:CopD family protein [Nitrospiraceae bacterium]